MASPQSPQSPQSSLTPHSLPADPAAALAHPAHPLDAALHRRLGAQCQAAGDELAALAHLIAAKAIDAWRADGNLQSARDLYLVATGYFMKGDYAVAERWYELVLMLDPQMAAVFQNRVVIHEHFGRFAEAEQCRARAYALQRVFIDPVVDPTRQLLILCAGRTRGNIPYEFLLSAGASQRIKYMIDYADVSEDLTLPHYDMVFNAIGEPDVAAGLQRRVGQFLQECRRPVINRHDQVIRTQRHLLPDLVGGIDNVKVAPCCRIDLGVGPSMYASWLAQHGCHFPVLIRPAATHGGEGMVRCDDLAALQQELQRLQNMAVSVYVASVVNAQSPDGFYRKYRVIFVDGQLYPYHLAISPHWISHYYTAEMEQHGWKIAEELRFLQDPTQVLGARAMQALAAISARLSLEYAGIDFTVLDDGSVLVFETNASMLVHRVSNSGPTAHKNIFVNRIAEAFEAMLRRFEQSF